MSDYISRQQAIDAIDSVLVEDESCKVWFKLAVKNLPSAQPEKRTETHACDCISRKAAIDAINHICPVDTEYDCTLLDRVDVRCVLSDLPSAQPKSYREGYQAGFKDAQSERKRGRWIYGEDNPGTGRDGWFCSECEHFEMWDYSADMKSAELNLPNYCPNCGADMREVDDERPD